MTNKEAAEIILNYNTYGCGYCHEGGDEVPEAFDMAAKALLKAQESAYWVEETDRQRHWHCSNCGTVQGIPSVMMKYCPECGYAMEEHPWAASGCGQAFCPGKDE